MRMLEINLTQSRVKKKTAVRLKWNFDKNTRRPRHCRRYFKMYLRIVGNSGEQAVRGINIRRSGHAPECNQTVNKSVCASVGRCRRDPSGAASFIHSILSPIRTGQYGRRVSSDTTLRWICDSR